jgi:hypothetical protein
MTDIPELQTAGALADALGKEVQENHGDLTTVYAALEKAALEYRASGQDLESAVPGVGSAALGFRRGSPDGKSLWSAYADVLHDDLCKPKGTLHKQVKAGLATSGATLIALIMTTLGLPGAAAMIVAPIAGSVLGMGVDAFCKSRTEK